MKTLKIFLTPFIIFFLFCPLPAQTGDIIRFQGKTEKISKFHKPKNIEKYFGKNFSNTEIKRQYPMIFSLTEPIHFPYQSTYNYYEESLPVQLSNGQILMVWVASDSLKCANSTDGGLTWGAPTTITTGNWCQNISGLRTNTNRVIIVWHQYDGTWMIYSDDNGFNWSGLISISNDANNIRTTVSQTVDGKLWLLYSRLDPATHYDLYCRTSTDDGQNWSAEQTLNAATGPQNYGMIANGYGNTLLAAFEDNSTGNWEIYLISSTDGGSNWSSPTPIVSSTLPEHQPRLLRQDNGNLWLIYYMVNPTPVLPGYTQPDIYYTQSFDGGSTWAAPTQFTSFAGNDTRPNAVLINDHPFVSFASWRWEQVLSQYQIWYGLIGTTEDTNPPPAVFNGFHLNVAADTMVEIMAFVDDETGISDAKISFSLNGMPLDQVQMYDDGLHNDQDAGDNIWCGAIGSFQIGDLIWCELSVSDVNANTVDVGIGDFYIPAIHNVGNVILNFLPNSQLGDEGSTSGSNAYWPRVNGDDYLCQGALWIGTNSLGDYRVMNIHYYDEDWTRTDGTPFTIASGTSDQGGNATFDDRFPWQQQRIGLQVHQQSYQWSASNRDDFIIFKYIIKNTGENGNLSDLYSAVWLDPDMDVEDADNDLAGFDQARSLIYMYDSQGTPNGYLGLKLLGSGNLPQTARAYNSSEDPEPFDDYSRYQYMTCGFPTISQTAADYRIILTAQPFDLTAGDSNSVAFGLVMGGSQSELQENADTMEMIYNNVIVGIKDIETNNMPREYSLSQNYPNPFNPSTKISWQVPEGSWQTLKVYDVLGREVATLVNEYRKEGKYEIEFNPESSIKQPPSGIYFYQLKAGNFIQTKKMLFLK